MKKKNHKFTLSKVNLRYFYKTKQFVNFKISK